MNPDDGFLYLPPSDIKKLQRYYRRLLNECHLQHLFDPDDILNQVFEKAQKMIESGQTIHSPGGWSKKVGERIILGARRREISKRKACRYLQYQWQQSHSKASSASESEHPKSLVFHESLAMLKQARPKDYQLVWLYFFQGLSWKQVAAELHPDTPIEKTLIDRVRKAGCRAKENLKQIVSKKLQDETN